ncbi:hypothetical protein E0Z10_g2591 [Xylaria hypoxylon]|uniref:Small acidic protein n=1 Tax=Xylaria hypoxylon TaxID=37992 RepID=A0A4Z0Z5P5_9PEZI|nr:hypothetical protein E0Z10_g2591 [Xylaria hypoxylon]
MDSEGPWQQLDAAKLRQDAEASEAKLKKQQEQRLIRAELRKEKRHVKSEAKQARKQNVQGAAKWTPERKAMEKQKKLATRGQKQEKRRRRMHLRADKLEAQARKLWTEAQTARARAYVLDQQKDDEDIKKNKLKKEIEHMAQDPENEDYIPLDAPPATDGPSTNTHADKTQRREDAELQEKTLDQIMEQELGPSITASGRHIEIEAERKRKRKEEKRAEKRKREAEEDEAEAPLTEAMDIDAETKAEDEIETPKERRKKRKVEKPSDDKNEAEATPVKKDKKKKQKDKKEHAAEESEVAESLDVNEAPKEKKDKKKKGKREEQPIEESISAPTTEGEANTNSGEQWNVSALEGDSKRKQKFLRLLGAGKANGIPNSGQNTSTSSKANIAKMQSDLEHQFDVGMKMKQEGHSHRKGLGA